MDKIEKIRNRINNVDQKEENNVFLTIGNVVMVICLIGVSGLTYCKIDENATFINSIFQSDISFKEMNDFIKGTLNSLFNIKGEVSEIVSFENEYISVGNNNYITTDNVVNGLSDGKVILINYQNDYKYFIVVQYINGVVALYTQIDDTSLMINQILKINDVIGIYNGEYFNCIFK